jgi:undecaprenyl-diphosphatase
MDYSRIVEAMVLGLIQGLTEFLPISSSAHLRIAGLFLPGAADPGATFTAITQIGTELAVILYFARDIGNIIRSWWLSVFSRGKTFGPTLTPEQRAEARLGWYIIAGTIPIGVVGMLLQDTIRETFRSLWLIAATLIVFGVLLYLADRLGRSKRVMREMSAGHGLAIGLAQMLALIPGVSRSGATISMARALGYEREAAARFAFLLAIPAVLASGFYELYTAIKESSVVGWYAYTPLSAETYVVRPYSWLETLTATTVAFVVGLAVIAFLMRYLKTRSFLPFVIYRIALGGTLLALLGAGVIQA